MPNEPLTIEALARVADEAVQHTNASRPTDPPDSEECALIATRAIVARIFAPETGIVEALEWIERHHGNNDMNHVDYRLAAACRAASALATSRRLMG